MPAMGQNRRINFEEPDFDKALAKAREAKRNLFVDCYTTWCGPCKMMDREVFTNDAVADYFNATFVNVKLDMEREGRELNKKYSISGYPTFLLLDGEGNLVHKMAGYYNPENFLRAVKLAAPEYALDELKKRFENGDHSPGTIEAYMFALKSENDYKTIAEMLARAPLYGSPEDIKEPARWRVFSTFQSDLNSVDGRFFLENLPAFRHAEGDMPVDAKLDQLYSGKVTEYVYWEARNPGVTFPMADFDAFIRELQGLEFDKASTTLAIALTEMLSREGDYLKAVRLMGNVLNLRVMNQHYERTYFLLFFEKIVAQSTDQEALKELLPIAEELRKKSPPNVRLTRNLVALANKLGDTEKVSYYNTLLKTE